MLFATIGIAILSFLISTYVVPIANLKFYSRVYDIKQVKPTFTLNPGLFYNGIDGYTIRVADRNFERDMLYGVMICDHTVKVENPEAAKAARLAAGIPVRSPGKKGRAAGGSASAAEEKEDFMVSSNNRIILADSGRMVIRDDGLFMRMTLYHGVSHESLPDNELRKKAGGLSGTQKVQVQNRYARYYFDTLIYNFDLTAFAMKRTDEQAFRTHHYMLNINELVTGMDSIVGLKDSIGDVLADEMAKSVHTQPAVQVKAEGNLRPFDLDGVLKHRRKEALGVAKGQAIVVHEKVKAAVGLSDTQDLSLRDYQIEFHSKYLLPIACIVFLLIGAPLGSIIRKGGLGLPILFSIVFYVAFYVLLVQGKKMAREGVLDPWVGVWLPLFVMTPIALFITSEATTEARILNARVWWLVWRRVSAVLWYLNPLRFLITLRLVRQALIAVLEFLLSLSPAEIRKRRAVRRRAQSMRITRGDEVEFVDRKKKK
jgi:lipopolysaccharide export system permease protein